MNPLFLRVPHILAAILVALSACSTSAERKSFSEDAANYCDVHKISYWAKSGKLEGLKGLNGIEKQQVLTKEIRSSVRTSEMQELIYVKGANVSLEEFYPYLQEAIAMLTGKPFDCPAIPSFICRPTMRRIENR